MKVPVFLIILAFCQLNCKAQNRSDKAQPGIYNQKESGKKLELKQDGSYILYNASVTFTPVIERCEYASKGKWKQISNDVLEITSENYYQKQEGFKYELKKENKLSQDSLYIEIHLSKDFLYYRDKAVNYYLSFNYNKRLEAEDSLIILSKSDYLWSKTPNSINRNHITFSLNANTSGTTLYKSRVMFEIFEEDIDTEKTNYLTITLPHFDLCFFEFEPYNQELLFVKSQKELIWQGKSWEKQP